MSNLSALMDLSTAILISGSRQKSIKFGFIFFLFAAMACEKETRPQDILSPEQMAAYMVEIYLAEARVNGALVPRDSAKGLFKPMEEKILTDAGISDSVLKKSYAYYLAHPDELERIYDSVIDTLALKEQRIKNIPVEKKP